MSKSKQAKATANQALRRQGRSVLVKPLDFDRSFIDALICRRVGVSVVEELSRLATSRE